MTSQSIPMIPMIKQFVALVKLEHFDNSPSFVEELAENVVSDLDLKVVKKMSYIFSPTGITLGYILSQSHLVIHTYPEKRVIHVDLVICNDHKEKEFENSLKYALSEHEIQSIQVKTLNFDG